MKRGRGRPALLLVLLLVNAAAVWGQAGWALVHIVPASWAPYGYAAIGLSLGFALAIETIGVFLALSADHAEDRDIPAGGIRLGSYAVGVASGLLNASHWGWVTAAAIAFGLLSASSPFLWGIHSRVNRERTIPPSRRFWHPRRSIALIRHMAWEGIPTEAEGIASMKSEPIVAEVGTPWLDPEALTTALAIQDAAAPRAPRAAKSEQEKAVRMLLDGTPTAEVVAATGVGASTLRRYVKQMRTLAADPDAVIDPAGEKVNASLLDIIRTHAKERAL